MIRILLIALTAVFSYDLNQQYKDLLHGRVQYDQMIIEQLYLNYQSTYFQKNFFRFTVFKNKVISIIQHNINPQNTWTKGINMFADVTNQEFRSMMLFDKQNCSATEFNLRIKNQYKAISAPINWDWREFGKVTDIKNQGNCGSCWAFSTTGCLEAHWNILLKGKNQSFSEQQLIDCAQQFDNHGCDGGLPSQAFQYIRYNGGIQTENDYPYLAKQNPSCQYNESLKKGYIKYGSYNITRGDENQLLERVYKIGPVSVAFKVVDGFHDYKSGVYQNDNCGTTPEDINHAVLAVGYGVENNVKYWIIKNSWGPAWGNKGYFNILRGSNMCAIGQCNSYPLIDQQVIEGHEQINRLEK